MTRSDRLLQVGGIVAGLGGPLAIGFLLFVLEVGGEFWTWPGWLGVLITAGGLLLVGMGLVLRDPSDGAIAPQHQRGGNRSRNYQAGRDVNIGTKGHDD